MADLPQNTGYQTGGASTVPPKASMANILGWKKPASAQAPAPESQLPNVLEAYKPVSKDVTNYLSSGGTSFLPGAPVGAPSEEKISPTPEGYSPFRTPGEFTNPASAVVPEQPMIQQFPQGGQMNIDAAHPKNLIKSERAYLGSNQNASILGTLSPKMFQVDHIIPLWAGGADTIANKQILPNPVHGVKTKIQAVAQTLLDHGEIDLNAARVMALNWKLRKDAGIPTPNDFGEIPIDTARAIAKEWELADQGRGKISVGDVVRGLPEAATTLGKGALPEWSRQFLVGMLAGATAHGIPLESAPGADLKDKAFGFAGEAIGMFSGIGLLAKATGVARTALFAKKAAAPIKIAASDTLGGASIFDLIKPAEELPNIAKGLKGTSKYSPKNVINTIRGNMSREIVGKMARNAALFAGFGQFGQTISDFTQPQQDAINAHISRLGMDIALGGVVGAFPATWKGAGKVGFGTMVIGLMAGENAQQALAQGVAMAGLHKVGGFAKDTSKIQKENEMIVDDSATKGSLAVLHGLLGNKMGLKRIDPSAPAPKYDPAMINEWEIAGRAEIERLDKEGALRPFAGAGAPPGDKFILESNLKTAIGWLRTRELPIEQQDRSYVQGLSSMARYAKDRNELNGVNVPTSLEPFVGKVKERAPEMINARPAQTLQNDRWVIEGSSNLGEGNPTYQGVTGEVRLTGQKANEVNKEQLDNFLQNLRDGNASPYVIGANQPELGIYFREMNRGLTPERIKAGDKEIDPDNYISVWGVVKDPKTGVINVVPTGVKVPTKERIGVVTRGPNGERVVEGNEYAFNKDLDIASGKWPEENPNFNNKTLGMYARSQGTPTFIMRIKAFKGKDLDPNNPYLVAQVGDREWEMTKKIWGELGAPSNYATYEENMARALASKNMSTAQPLLLKAAEQRAEMGDNASTIVKNESFVGANEPRQGALFEMSDKANKVLVSAKTPEEVKAGFDQELGVQLTPEEASSISSKRGTMTGGDLVATVGKAAEEGRTTPLTAGSYFTYIRPLKTSRVFRSSESGLLFDKMPILSKAESQQAMAGRLSAASGERPVSSGGGLLEQAPITKVAPTEAPTGPGYKGAVDQLEQIGLERGSSIEPGATDTYTEKVIQFINNSGADEEGKKALAKRAIEILNSEDELALRGMQRTRSDAAWTEGQRSSQVSNTLYPLKNDLKVISSTFPEKAEEANGLIKTIDETIKTYGGGDIPVDPGESQAYFSLIKQIRSAIDNVKKETVGIKPPPAAATAAEEAQIARKEVAPWFEQINKDRVSSPDTYQRGYAQVFDELAKKAWGKDYQQNEELMKLLTDKTAVGKKVWLEPYREKGKLKPGLLASQPITARSQIGQPVEVVEAAGAGDRAAMSAAITKRGQEPVPKAGSLKSIQGETGSEGNVEQGASTQAGDIVMTGGHLTTPGQEGIHTDPITGRKLGNVKDLTPYESERRKGLLDEEVHGPDPIKSPIRGAEDAMSDFFGFWKAYNNAIRSGELSGKKAPFVEKDVIVPKIKEAISAEYKMTSEIGEAIKRAQAKIDELNKQDETLANVGGSRAIKHAQAVKKDNDRMRAQLGDLIKKYSKGGDGQGGPGLFPSRGHSPLNPMQDLFTTQGESSKFGPIEMGPTTFASTIKQPELTPLKTFDAIKPRQNIVESLKTLAPTPKVKIKEPEQIKLPDLNPLLGSRTTGLTSGTKSTPDVPARGQAYYLGKNGQGFPQTSHPVIAGVDMSEYAENPRHIESLKNIIATLPLMSSAQDYQAYISRRAPKSPVTGQMVANAVAWNQLNPEEAKLLMAAMVQDSSLGTAGIGVRTKNPGNVGNTGSKIRIHKDWQDGVNAVSNYIAQHREIPRGVAKTTDKSRYIDQAI